MRAGLVVTGVLGTGTVLVFALAGLVATLFPNGTLVATNWNGGGVFFGKPGVAVPVPMPMPVPGIDGVPEKGVIINDAGSAIGPTGTDDDILPQP